MKNKTAILFDLDGTIIDASESIVKTARAAMKAFGVEPDPSDNMLHVIGPPIMDTFRDIYNLDQETAAKVTDYYREMYGKEGIYECKLYEGIDDLIRALKAQGKKVLMATSKPEVYAQRIMENLGLLDCFDAIAGPGLKGEHTKADMIRRALEEGEVTDLSTAVQVGDRYFDVEGAAEAGIDCIGVLYGFGSREELDEAGATELVESVQALGVLLGAWK